MNSVTFLHRTAVAYIPPSRHYQRGCIHLDLDEHRVVLDERSASERVVRDELRIAEPDRPDVLPRSLEMFPRRIRREALEHARSFLGVRALVEQPERDRLSERPLEQVVVFADEHVDVDGDVRAFAGAVAAQERRRSHAIAAATRVERRAENVAVVRGGRGETRRYVCDLPQHRAVGDLREELELRRELTDSLLLRESKLTHQRQVFLRAPLQVRVHAKARALKAQGAISQQGQI